METAVAEWKRPSDALIANDIEGALQWYEKRRANLLEQPVHLHNWARLLCSIGRRHEATPLIERLAQSEDYAMFVAGQRLLDAMERGLSSESALVSTPLGAAERYRPAITAALPEFDIGHTPPDARHIAITGISFCGSTILDLILEGLPGVGSIGESIWLTLGWIGDGPAPFPFGGTRGTPGIQACNYCGPDCEYLTTNFRTALGLNPIDWYFRIAERLNTKILVSSEKNLPKIILFEPRLRLTGLVVFKSPKQAWSSNYTKISKNFTTPEQGFDAMVKFMDVWKQAYGEAVNLYRPRDGRVFVDFDRFSNSPAPIFRSLVTALDLKYDPDALVAPSPGHSLGGNGNAINGVRKGGQRVNIYPLPEPAIPPDHAAWIDSQPDVNDLHATLRELSAKDLSLDR
jgi:hypothetical protein